MKNLIFKRIGGKSIKVKFDRKEGVMQMLRDFFGTKEIYYVSGSTFYGSKMEYVVTYPNEQFTVLAWIK